jgi:hypothetical protein
MIRQIAEALAASWANFATGVALFVPRLLAALIIILVGWVLAAAVRAVVRRLLAWVSFDRLIDRAGATEMLHVAELPRAEVLMTEIAFWVVFIGFVLSGVDALQFQALDGMVAGFVRFVPRFVLSLVILAFGLLIANFVWRATLLAAVNGGLPSARIVAGAMRLVVVAISIAMALEQLGLRTTVVLTAFAIAFGAVMLGLAIAFGLGGRDAARQVLEQQLKPKGRRDSDVAPHL